MAAVCIQLIHHSSLCRNYSNKTKTVGRMVIKTFLFPALLPPSSSLVTGDLLKCSPEVSRGYQAALLGYFVSK